MIDLIQKLQLKYPDISFIEGQNFRWSPSIQTITYILSDIPENRWSLFHELGHGILNHKAYESDIELLQKEVAAWHEALKIAPQFDMIIDTEHVQTCLDSYRDWLHKRSTCPDCSLQGIQKTSDQYMCLNCKHAWLVTSARFCRPYRRSQ
jgi:hypothetical protein